MAYGTARSAVRTSNRAWFIGLIVIIILLVIAVGLSWNAYYNAIAGPFDTPVKDITQRRTLDGLREYFVTVRTRDVIDTGWEMVYSQDGQETKREGYAAVIYNTWVLLVELDGPYTEGIKSYTGRLVPVPANVQRQILEKIYERDPGLRGKFAPFMLDTEDTETQRREILAGLAALVISGVISLILLGRTLKRITDNTRHPIMRALARYGDPEAIAREIDTEMVISRAPAGNHASVSAHWLVYHKGGTFHAARLRDITQAYRQVKHNRIEGTTSYRAHVADGHGHRFTIKAEYEDVEALLQTIAERAPWAIHDSTPVPSQGLGAVIERSKAFAANGR
ncbi:MAG: hypothetical protein KJ065_13070 [Anaerolineae bacterium]|nr:hypothetical protein [Anaerolineae bacterium]